MQSFAPQLSADVRHRIIEAADFVFDVDLTLTFRQANLDPELAQSLKGCGKRCGIATSRALDELDEAIDASGILRADLFNGPVIVEDGSVVQLPNQPTPQLFAPLAATQALALIKQRIEECISPVPEQHPYGALDTITDPLVRLAPYKYLASLSLWQLATSQPPQYHAVMEWVHSVARELQSVDALQFVEIGDGTLRISAPGMSKGSALERLHSSGVIDLRRVAFFGDGRNDLHAAQVVRDAGGIVVATDLHCEPLVHLAHASAPRRGIGPTFVHSILRSLPQA